MLKSDFDKQRIAIESQMGQHRKTIKQNKQIIQDYQLKINEVRRDIAFINFSLNTLSNQLLNLNSKSSLTNKLYDSNDKLIEFWEKYKL